jgi:hypothetical protein
MKKAQLSMNTIVIAVISLTVLVVVIMLVVTNIKRGNEGLDNAYESQQAQLKMEDAKASCRSACRSGSVNYFNERGELSSLKEKLGLTDLHCWSLINDKCDSKIEDIKNEVDDKYVKNID